MEESTRAVEEVLIRKIKKLEECRDRLTNQISNLVINNSGSMESLKTESQCVNILQSMGRTVHMFDVNNRIVYWNQMAETLYGYTAAEAIGKTAPEIVIAPAYSEFATHTIQRALKGETWTGQLPIRTKSGERFDVITTLAPCRDANGTIFGVTCVCVDTRQFQELGPQANHPLDPTALVSKISILANKVKLKMKTKDINMHHDSDEGFTGNHTTDSKYGSENSRVFSLKASAWTRKYRISWPWKVNDNRDCCEITKHFGWPWLHNNDQDQDSGSQTSYNNDQDQDSGSQTSYNNDQDQDSGSQTSSSASLKVESEDIENMDVEISWDDLTIGEQIAQGSHGSGTVYHALLYGSDVAAKIFTKQEYANDLILSFRKEVCLMKRLRHPNILLFMGAVISPRYLCIVTEFLPRGSLFRLLQRSTTKLGWRRCVRMAMDIAQGMIYLHSCQPPIVHHNLKSSNLLVDDNWRLKVGDFGLSHIKHETYLKTDVGTITPHWMAPEVLRNEQVDEKSDVYSYGVVLWEITTGKIPWENHNALQVIGAVGFMNQRLEIPDEVDPQWASLIESCWSSDPTSRPTFREILNKLKDLQTKFSRAL